MNSSNIEEDEIVWIMIDLFLLFILLSILNQQKILHK